MLMPLGVDTKREEAERLGLEKVPAFLNTPQMFRLKL